MVRIRPPQIDCTGVLQRLGRDTSGNVLAIIAASLLPLLAMLGGAVDMGRGYLVQARLQQACDAGVLAARKRLGTEVTVTDDIPDKTAEIGERFFETNFKKDLYGTSTRSFEMTLEDDYAISGVATARMPTRIMAIFGEDFIDVSADCSAQLNMSNTDVMMVLDVTGSMALTNDGDTDARIDVLKATVRSFYDQLAASASEQTRIRYGFLPYSTNVNVGALLDDDWVLEEWKYQSRAAISAGMEEGTRTYNRNWQHVSGTRTEWVVYDSYAATWHSGTGVTLDENENVVTGSGYYTCDSSTPSSTKSWNSVILSTATEAYAGPPEGTRTIEYRQSVEDGRQFQQYRNDDTCIIRYRDYTDYTQTYERVTDPTEKEVFTWRYQQLTYDMADWRSIGNGCIEERDTYEIDDYDNVDFTRALDLDLNLVPHDDDSRWRPMYPDVIYARAMLYDDTGSFSKPIKVTDEDYVAPAVIGAASCPPAARKLGAMTGDELDTYLDSLYPSGATYHDIGMIWGGRLISPSGLFASENADVSAAQPTSRHMIFLTDGETETLDLAYSAYGLEPLDERRWTESSTLSLDQTVEKRFSVACEQVRKLGVTVWIVGFGTELSTTMKGCAGAGRYFEAADAAELNSVFADIAESLAELRIVE